MLKNESNFPSSNHRGLVFAVELGYPKRMKNITKPNHTTLCESFESSITHRTSHDPLPNAHACQTSESSKLAGNCSRKLILVEIPEETSGWTKRVSLHRRPSSKCGVRCRKQFHKYIASNGNDNVCFGTLIGPAQCKWRTTEKLLVFKYKRPTLVSAAKLLGIVPVTLFMPRDLQIRTVDECVRTSSTCAY